MNSKPFYVSKTFWVNLLAVVAALLAASGVDILDAELQAEVVAVIMGIVNLGLRLVTKMPVTVMEK